MYGRRKASQYFTDRLAKSLSKFGAERAPDAPHLFRTPGKPKDQVVIVAHIDDFNCCGDRKQLEKLAKFLRMKDLNSSL